METPVTSLGSRSGVNCRRLDRAVDGPGQRLGQRRLADAGHVLDQQVALGEQGDQRDPDDLRLADQDTFDVRGDPLDGRVQLVQGAGALLGVLRDDGLTGRGLLRVGGLDDRLHRGLLPGLVRVVLVGLHWLRLLLVVLLVAGLVRIALAAVRAVGVARRRGGRGTRRHTSSWRSSPYWRSTGTGCPIADNAELGSLDFRELPTECVKPRQGGPAPESRSWVARLRPTPPHRRPVRPGSGLSRGPGGSAVASPARVTPPPRPPPPPRPLPAKTSDIAI